MFKWIHHLLNPHCPECQLERAESKVCNSCEILKMEIAQLRSERDKLLDKIINPTVITEEKPNLENLKPIKPMHMPWSARRAALEAEDRRTAQLLKQQTESDNTNSKVSNGKPLTAEDIEKELGVADVS